jgi:hypothetical protein
MDLRLVQHAVVHSEHAEHSEWCGEECCSQMDAGWGRGVRMLKIRYTECIESTDLARKCHLHLLMLLVYKFSTVTKRTYGYQQE